MNKKIFSIVIMSILFFAMIGGNVFAAYSTDDYEALRRESTDDLYNGIVKYYNASPININEFFTYTNACYNDLSEEQKSVVDGYIKNVIKNYREQLKKAMSDFEVSTNKECGIEHFWTTFEGGQNIINSVGSQTNSEEDKKAISNDWFGKATSWWGDAKKSGFTIPQEAQDVIDQFTDMINIIGTTLIFVATIVLGIKFIFGSIDGKSEAKEDMITLLVACVFFFGWNGIMGILLNDAHNDIAIVEGAPNYEVVLSKMLTIFRTISNCLLVVGVIYVGIKFIFAGAQGKADLKAKSGFFIIGIILAFCTVNVLTFLSDVINQVLTKT